MWLLALLSRHVVHAHYHDYAFALFSTLCTCPCVRAAVAMIVNAWAPASATQVKELLDRIHELEGTLFQVRTWAPTRPHAHTLSPSRGAWLWLVAVATQHLELPLPAAVGVACSVAVACSA